MKTNFYVPREECKPENYSVEFYDISIEANKKYIFSLLLNYKSGRSAENYEKDRLEYKFQKIKHSLVVKFKNEVILVVCLAIHNNWILLTRAIKFKYWKDPLLLGLCIQPLLDFQKINNYDGIFLTFNEHNRDYLEATFKADRYKYRSGWLVDNVRKYSQLFEYDLNKKIYFNGVNQYLVKTKSKKELII
jgi:hypothetical protein